jgi:hypothetical protein
VFEDGSWWVEYLYGFEEESWFPDVLRVSACLVFNGLEFVKFENSPEF